VAAAGGGVSELLVKLERYLLSGASVRNACVLASLFLLSIVIDRLAHRGMERYRSKSTLNDFIYYLFYYGGPYQFLILTPLFGFLSAIVQRYAPWTRTNLLAALPLPLRVAVFILLFDFFGYWSHRWVHEVPALWAFHRVHHSQQSLTVLTNYRRHPVDEIFPRLVMFLGFLFLGTTVITWAVVDVAANAILLLQHSGLTWTFGKVEHVFVSPRMHGLHHSIDEQHLNRNYGMLFSFWDWMFRTRLLKGTVETCGVVPAMPESLWHHFIDPFHELGSRERIPAAAEPGTVA
jgi:sterol desaturase/sphingolipid hydroxylase (fatty acid hydroxylase superfamily)